MNSLSLLYAQQLVGTKIGTFYVKHVVKEGADRFRIVVECTLCGCANKLPLANLQAEERTPGSVRCTNWQRHPAPPKAAPVNWQSMSDAEFAEYFAKMSSEDYRKVFGNKAFTDRVNRIPQPKTRKEAIAAKEEAALNQKREEAQKIVSNLYHACLANNHKMPIDKINGTLVDGWLALTAQQKAGIVQYYSLDTQDWRPHF